MLGLANNIAYSRVFAMLTGYYNRLYLCLWMLPYCVDYWWKATKSVYQNAIQGLASFKKSYYKKKNNDVIRQQQFRLLNSGDGGAYNINCDWWRIIGFFYLLCLGYEDRVRRTATTVEERRPKKKNEEPVWKYNTV